MTQGQYLQAPVRARRRARPGLALVAGIAIAALAGSSSPAPAALQDGVVWIALCHGGATRLPLSTGQRRGPKSWPIACHAFCLPTRKGARRAAGPDGEPA